MYLVKHIKNQVYYKSEIHHNFNHYVFNKEEAYQFKNKWEVNRFLKSVNHPENFEWFKI